MLSTDDFLLQYEGYSDGELYHIYKNKDDYSPEAHDALDIVIKKRGGQHQLIERLKQQQERTNEIKRINALATVMARRKIDIGSIKTMISSSLLSPEQVAEIIDQSYDLVHADNEDRKISSRTIVGSFFAVIIAGAVGGIGWGLQLIYAPGIEHKIEVILFVGLVLLCYGIVKVFTRQSRKNVVVLVATVISVLLSLFIGWMIAGAHQ